MMLGSRLNVRRFAMRKTSFLWTIDNLNRLSTRCGEIYQTPAEFAARCCSSVRATPSLQNSSGPLTLDPLIKAGT